MNSHNLVTSVVVLVVTFVVLKLLPLAIKKSGFSRQVGDKGLFYIYVAIIAYVSIIFIILPVSEAIVNALPF